MGEIMSEAKSIEYMLRELAGYVENGTSETVIYGQDDASREWFLKIGKRRYGAVSFQRVVALAYDLEGDRYERDIKEET